MSRNECGAPFGGLGMVPDAQFTQTNFRFNEDDRLILLRNPIAAADVVSAAQAYGQQDDITVIRIVREAVAAPHTGTEPAIAV